jgi:hypothetical protein
MCSYQLLGRFGTRILTYAEVPVCSYVSPTGFMGSILIAIQTILFLRKFTCLLCSPFCILSISKVGMLAAFYCFLDNLYSISHFSIANYNQDQMTGRAFRIPLFLIVRYKNLVDIDKRTFQEIFCTWICNMACNQQTFSPISV